jgi:hypothetical protein
MATALRSIAAIVAAMIVAFILLSAVEYFSEIVYPSPPGAHESMEIMCEHVKRYPAWVLAVAVAAWAITAFAGTWIAGRLGNRFCALFIGLLLLAALILNLSMLPYPIWFKVSNLVAIPIAIYVGDRMSYRLRAKAQPSAAPGLDQAANRKPG